MLMKQLSPLLRRCLLRVALQVAQQSLESVRDAMICLVPDGGSFIRVHDAGVFRSLDQSEIRRLQRSVAAHAVALAG
jgi:hypothetical protein